MNSVWKVTINKSNVYIPPKLVIFGLFHRSWYSWLLKSYAMNWYLFIVAKLCFIIILYFICFYLLIL